MSQSGKYNPSSGPGSGTVTSISQGTGITLTPNPITTTGTVALTIPVAIANGGTNATTFATTDGTVIFDGTRLVTTATGTAGQVLTSNGVGVAPTYQSLAASAVTSITGDTGGAQTGAITLTGSLSAGSSVSFDGSLGTVTFNVTDADANTLMGKNAGNATLTGTSNTSVGNGALHALTTGSFNIAIGDGALNVTQDSTNDVAIGYHALVACTTGADNIAIGYNSASSLLGGNNNISIGTESLSSVTSGNNNVCVGYTTLNNITSGAFNTAVGDIAGSGLTTTDSSNLLLAHTGITGDVHTIRIGTSGSGDRQQNKCFIAGIDGVDVGSVATIVTEASDQLGTAVLTAGTGISITPGANTITIASTGGMTWSEVTGTSQSMAVNHGYILNNVALVTATLPATAAVGDIVAVVGSGSGGWAIAQNAGQTIHFGNQNTTTGAGGSLASTNRYDSIELICNIANTDWVARSSIGNITVV